MGCLFCIITKVPLKPPGSELSEDLCPHAFENMYFHGSLWSHSSVLRPWDRSEGVWGRTKRPALRFVFLFLFLSSQFSFPRIPGVPGLPPDLSKEHTTKSSP